MKSVYIFETTVNRTVNRKVFQKQQNAILHALKMTKNSGAEDIIKHQVMHQLENWGKTNSPIGSYNTAEGLHFNNPKLTFNLFEAKIED